MNTSPHSVRATTIILRWGLAFVFFYAAIAGLVRPEDWVVFFPKFLRDMLPQQFLLTGFSLFEIFLAAWLFWGKKLVWSAAVSVAMLVGIVVFNFDLMPIVFRDIGLMFAALALLELARGSSGKVEG
ncbi:MAG: hypothetical protein A2945_02985 [Candidatus Liptonbacteria bacterium RIFCSPLOWO2_01_FULL_52_25]|uniref:DoxX family protein n=1 Tax=Candidatus Liptonbacteria bacterium RIFCSPLOWO2_01_FULL_52_25 TaxID=1798650 RepID=A0A1G2CDX9_9BACT|nr:MAG: hypothetical protein A2945_02985 [Candidatus Liptonbacteria bacterium RIFCSPLOWO2_01_FULL_52_25]